MITRWRVRNVILGVLLTCAFTFPGAFGATFDSSSDFSPVQGQKNWYYGYYNWSADADHSYDSAIDFTLFTQWGMDGHPEYGAMWYGPGWSRLWAIGGHPNSSPCIRPVRRWVSTSSSTVVVTGRTWKLSGYGSLGGGGLTASVLVDGVEMYSRYVGPYDTDGAPYTVTLQVNAGSCVDFLIDPGDDDGSDHCGFTATFSAPPVPDNRPIYGISARGACDKAARDAISNCRFRIWGRVTTRDAATFDITDGSGEAVTVVAPGYSGIASGDMAIVTGFFDASKPQPTLVSYDTDVRKAN